jgi:uncharacterized protein (TIGR00255 family)
MLCLLKRRWGLPAFPKFAAMIQSMTGFGKSQITTGMRTLTVDIRALNSKQLDLNLRLSGLFREKEGDIRQEISRRLERGKLDVSIQWKAQGAPSARLNLEGLGQRYSELRELAAQLNAPQESLFGTVATMPDLMQEAEEELDEALWKLLQQALHEALDATERFRSDEGKGLEKELRLRVEAIEAHLQQIEALDPERQSGIRERLRGKMQEWEISVDENRFEEEMIFYLEKLDISEEKQRLRTHCGYFLEVLAEHQSQGRKLGFITQEMGREINTIGSKANHAGMQKLVVLMKDELEKIKEQLNNVL